MTPQEWLVKWMELKAELIGSDEYFNEADKKELLKLDNADACLAVNKIIHEGRDAARDSWLEKPRDLFYSGFCPFCIINEDECEICVYKKNHSGIACDEDGSDYDKAVDLARGVSHKPIQPLLDFLSSNSQLDASEEPE